MGLFDYTKQVQFLSAFSIEETQEKLAKVTANLVYSDLAPAMRFKTIGPTDGFLFNGKVSKYKVRLSRVWRYWVNSFKPYFYGKLVNTDNKVLLEGKFTMHTFIKALLSLSMVFLGVFCILLIFGTLDNVSSFIWQIIIKVFIIAMIVGLSVVSKKAFKAIGKNDIEWIKARLKELGLTEVA